MDNHDYKHLLLSEEESTNLQQCGSVGFTPEQIAIIFAWPLSEVSAQFDEKDGIIYTTYMQGRLQSELNIRSAILKSAENGSTPSQLQIQEFYRIADEIIGD